MDDGVNLDIGASWSFDAPSTVSAFESHIEASVPLYKESHQLTIDILPFFISRGKARVLDIGCSTGNFLRLIHENYSTLTPSLTGIDISSEMVKAAKRKGYPEILFLNANYLSLEDTGFDVISSFYTVQFVAPKDRQALIDKVFHDLNWGGAFFFFEKVRGSDARFNELLAQSLDKFKERNGLTEEQIYRKTKSLRGILEPFSSPANEGLLKRAGFSDIETIIKYGPFEGRLAIK